jgi:hypothetical protein
MDTQGDVLDLDAENWFWHPSAVVELVLELAVAPGCGRVAAAEVDAYRSIAYAIDLTPARGTDFRSASAAAQRPDLDHEADREASE